MKKNEDEEWDRHRNDQYRKSQMKEKKDEERVKLDRKTPQNTDEKRKKQQKYGYRLAQKRRMQKKIKKEAWKKIEIERRGSKRERCRKEEIWRPGGCARGSWIILAAVANKSPN
jgi:hypothetical protein